MLENHMVLPAPAKHFDGTCPTCGTDYETSAPRQQDKDGYPVHQHHTFDCPMCGAEICEECERNAAAFTCEKCSATFCATHKRDLDGEGYCPTCYPKALAAAYEDARREVAAREAEIKVYEAACARIFEVKATDAPEDVQLRDAEWAWALGKARGIAFCAPREAQAAAITAA